MSITTNPLWNTIEHRSASAFGLAGLLILASLVAPIGLEPVVESAWAVGFVLVGVAVLAISIGLIGLYPRVQERRYRVASVGALGAGIAAGAAISLIGLGSIALVGAQSVGITSTTPMAMFSIIGLSMAVGFASGLLAFGIAILQTETLSQTIGWLLAVGGAVLLVPVITETAGVGLGIQTPPWILFPIIAFVALDALVIGHRLHTHGLKQVR